MVRLLKTRLFRSLSRWLLRYKRSLFDTYSILPQRHKRFRLAMVSIIAISLWVTISSLKKEEQLVLAKPMTILSKQLPVAVPKPSSGQPKLLIQGDAIALNGRTRPALWSQWQLTGSQRVRIGVADVGLTQTIGVELLSTWDSTRQPVQWFSEPAASPLILATWLTNQYRYLDITDFAHSAGWQIKVDGTTLRINSPAATVNDIRQDSLIGSDKETVAHRIVLDLDRPTPWQVSQEGAVLTLQIDGVATPSLLSRYNPKPPDEVATSNQGFPPLDAPIPPISPPKPGLPLKIETSQDRTTIRVDISSGLRPRIWSLPSPYRLVIDIAPEAMVERDIIWAPGLRYRQQILSLGTSRFPVVWLEINPRQSVALRPIWGNRNSLVGTAPLIEQAKQWQVAGAINAGFFNRNTQLPLGAIRLDGRWLSSPILNRGAIAWNDAGEVKIGHLSLQETLNTSTGEHLPIVSVNSGYVQSGFALHTTEWGSTYNPLTDNETIITVQNNQVISAEAFSKTPLPNGIPSKTSFPIPPDGYLVVLRDSSGVQKLDIASALAIGNVVTLESYSVPAEFDRYPHIVGAGPVLLQKGKIVLDAKAEQFRDSFINESAHRSAIGTTTAGNILIVAVGNRTVGPGPSLNEIAELMRLIGAVDALNLDGGSSTSLYLGGQLINRAPRSAARVHNGLGIFIGPNP
ncbi:phosphodiester glycosidase family protein [Argonema galeatum]|uniref:phosphodiester glycosidase family protein n=1 Tax=Argonema galeatum TaxID=2942762 RepID=UPI002012102D|nr:phosphodiester glycosidase family protein [Argonema galeatum]MCL1468453.1 phosphodiester glycosidase family protein [Argonema galeatum A003/A1]